MNSYILRLPISAYNKVTAILGLWAPFHSYLKNGMIKLIKIGTNELPVLLRSITRYCNRWVGTPQGVSLIAYLVKGGNRIPRVTKFHNVSFQTTQDGASRFQNYILQDTIYREQLANNSPSRTMSSNLSHCLNWKQIMGQSG